MHLLKSCFFNFLIIILLSSIYCKPQSPVTPEGAFYKLRAASSKGDVKKLESLLSNKSIIKLNTISRLVSNMNEEQKKSFSIIYKISPKDIKKFNIKTFLKIYFNTRSNVIAGALKYNITGVDLKNGYAVISVENGINFKFVKEGPYWKFDMTEF